MPGLVPGIQPSAGAGSCTMDPGDKRRDDVSRLLALEQKKQWRMSCSTCCRIW